MDEISEKVNLRGVVVGKEYTSDHKVAMKVRLLDGSPIAEGLVRFYHASYFRGRVGHMYSFDGTPDGSNIYPSSVEYIGAWPVTNERAEWEAIGRAFDVAYDARALAKKEVTVNMIKEQLQPLRLAYLKTNTQGKLALKVLVLHYLETGEALK